MSHFARHSIRFLRLLSIPVTLLSAVGVCMDLELRFWTPQILPSLDTFAVRETSVTSLLDIISTRESGTEQGRVESN